MCPICIASMTGAATAMSAAAALIITRIRRGDATTSTAQIGANRPVNLPIAPGDPGASDQDTTNGCRGTQDRAQS